MGTREILRSLGPGQKASMDGSEYIISLWSRATALNYPVVSINGFSDTIPLFLEKISYSTTAGQVEVYASTTDSAIAAPSNSSIRYFNKRFITGNVSGEFLALNGEITPAQYSALVFGEDLYTRKVNEGVFDFTTSNIILQGDPKVANSKSCIMVVGVGAATELFASFDVKSIYKTSNDK